MFGNRESSLPQSPSGVNFAPAPLRPELPNAADRLVSVDPVMAAHRPQYGAPPSTRYVHPEQYDAALRAHPGMPPPPDPHDYQRRCRDYWQSIRVKHVVKDDR